MFEDKFFSYEKKWFSNIDLHDTIRLSKPVLKTMTMKKKNKNIENLVYRLERHDLRINLSKFIPASVKVLEIWTRHSLYKTEINLSSFTNLIYLDITKYNKPIKSFPPNLVVLKFDFDSNFNKPLLNLPSSLRWLELGDKFNQSIVLNEGLEYVRFGKYFNSPIESLPSTLIYLELGQDFDWNNMKTELPESLKEIRIFRNDNSKSNFIIRDIIEMVPSIENIMIGDLFSSPMYDYDFDEENIWFSNPDNPFTNLHEIRTYGNSSPVLNYLYIREQRIPFVLLKEYKLFQSFGKYVNIQHLFCGEIQDFMENEIIEMKSRFNFHLETVTEIFNRNLFREERYLAVGYDSGAHLCIYSFLDIDVNFDVNFFDFTFFDDLNHPRFIEDDDNEFEYDVIDETERYMDMTQDELFESSGF